jgi:hypothetical protein
MIAVLGVVGLSGALAFSKENVILDAIGKFETYLEKGENLSNCVGEGSYSQSKWLGLDL